MEQAIRKGLKVCPFLSKSSVNELCKSTSLVSHASRCPVMLPAIRSRSFAAESVAPKERSEEEALEKKNCPALDEVVFSSSSPAPSPNSHPKLEPEDSFQTSNLPASDLHPLDQFVVPPLNAEAQEGEGKVHKGFDFNNFFKKQVEKKKQDKTYRYFNQIDRLASTFPKAASRGGNEVTVWCSNDYLGMSRHPVVLNAIKKTLDHLGAGAGGTRNIAGNGSLHEELEREIADLHQKEAGLVFSSCYVANDSALSTLGSMLPGCIFFSDESNHASMIQGMKHSGAKKKIFRHNDVDHLEQLLKESDPEAPKIVAFESVYSMSGSMGKVRSISQVAHRYGAMTFLDEVHAVGLYAHNGAGVAHLLGLSDHIDIFSGTLGKAYGNVGGYIAGKAELIDMIRSYAAGFIFTTSLPPAVVAGSLASIRYLKNSTLEREGQQEMTRLVKRSLEEVGIPYLRNPSHIVPVMVCEADTCKRASDQLLVDHQIYVQSINFPTVSFGAERLRITPTPHHTPEMVQHLVNSLVHVWKENNLQFREPYDAEPPKKTHHHHHHHHHGVPHPVHHGHLHGNHHPGSLGLRSIPSQIQVSA